ncbi:MAG: hypothetical protein JKX94_08330 [Sneathiella sp.]|nr:hypothetical protein [Sneathiella sp.]
MTPSGESGFLITINVDRGDGTFNAFELTAPSLNVGGVTVKDNHLFLEAVL